MQNKNQAWFYKQMPEYGNPRFTVHYYTDHSKRLQNVPTSVIGNNVAPYCTPSGNNGQYSSLGHNSLVQTGQVQVSHQTSMQINIGGHELIQHQTTQNYAFNAPITQESLKSTTDNDTNYGQYFLGQNYIPNDFNGTINYPGTQTLDNVNTHGQYPNFGGYNAVHNGNTFDASVAKHPPKDQVYNMPAATGQINSQRAILNLSSLTSQYKNDMMKEFNSNVFHQQSSTGTGTQMAGASVFYQGNVRLPIKNSPAQFGMPMSNGNLNYTPEATNVNTMMTSNITQNRQLQNTKPTVLQQMMINESMSEYPATYSTGRKTLNHNLENNINPLPNAPDTNILYRNNDMIKQYQTPQNDVEDQMYYNRYGSEALVSKGFYAGNRKEKVVKPSLSVGKRKQEIFSNKTFLEKDIQEVVKFQPFVENNFHNMNNRTSSFVEGTQEIIQGKNKEAVANMPSFDKRKQETMKSKTTIEERNQKMMKITPYIDEEKIEMNKWYTQTSPLLKEMGRSKRKSPVPLTNLNVHQNDINNSKRQRTDKETPTAESRYQQHNGEFDSCFKESKVSKSSDQSMSCSLDSLIEEKSVYDSIETVDPDNEIQTNEEKRIKNDKNNFISKTGEEDVHEFIPERRNIESSKEGSPSTSVKSDKNDAENMKSNTTASGNNVYNKPSLQGRQLENNKNSALLKDVLSARYPRFMIFFHGQHVLCMKKENRKYMVLRELIFYFFQDSIEKVQSCLKELSISKIMITGKEKEDVSKYLYLQKVFTDKSVKNVGIIELQDANRIYHKLFPESKCHICVKLVDRKRCVRDKKKLTDTVIDITESDDEEHDHMDLNRNEQVEPIKDKFLEKQNTESIEKDQDSDTTLNVDDGDIKNTLEVKPSVNKEEIITTGVMELGGNLLRYVMRDSYRYVPIKDLKKIFSQNIIDKTVQQISCSITNCTDIEATHFQQFDYGFCEIVQGDDMVDSEILEHIYIVASLIEDNGVEDKCN